MQWINIRNDKILFRWFEAFIIKINNFNSYFKQSIQIIFEGTMKKMILVLVFFITIPFYSQESSSQLFIPRNVNKTYDLGIRNYDGKPGKNYWINSSEYNISAFVDTKSGILFGKEKVLYHNNSRDTLKTSSV